jgi:DNA-binding PadR family transcriptional regulator
VAGVALDGFDDIRNQIVPPLELHVDIRPGVIGLNVQPDESVVDPHDGYCDDGEDREDDDESHVEIIGRDIYIHFGYTRRVSIDADTLLPLPPAAFHILVALADEDRHGYAIMQDVAARTSGAVKLSAGTLYRSVQRMLDQGLIVEVSSRPAPEMDDERRRYYRITPFGRTVAKAEARRLAEMLRLARASGFAPGKA